MTVEHCGSPLLEGRKHAQIQISSSKEELWRGQVLASFAIAALALICAQRRGLRAPNNRPHRAIPILWLHRMKRRSATGGI